VPDLQLREPARAAYAGTASTTAAPAPLTDTPTLRIVTFNVQYAQHIDRAIALLESSAALRDADVIALQEMDAPGTQRIAAALGMSYVYYPASVAPATGRDFGTRSCHGGPRGRCEIVLPHRGFRWFGAHRDRRHDPRRRHDAPRVQRASRGPRWRSDRARAAIKCGRLSPTRRPTSGWFVGGDMNSRGVGEEFRAAKFAWLTEHDSKTHLLFNWDHIFFGRRDRGQRARRCGARYDRRQ